MRGDRRRRRACARGVLGAGRARAGGARRGARTRGCEVLAALGRGAGLRGRRRGAVRRARPLAGDPGAVRGARVRDWEEAPAHAGELAALYSAYHRRLERLGAVDAEGFARAALDGAARAARPRGAARPVFLYGFDDLTPLQRDAVETLGRATPTCASRSPYEPGRAAFAGRAATVELLKPLAERHELLDGPLRALRARPPATRCTTSSAGCSSPAPAGVPPNGAVRLLEAGGERAEAELVAAEVLELTRRRASLPEDIAVLVRGGAAEAGVLGQVLDELRRPGQPRRAGSRSAARGSAPACSPAPARRCPAARPPTC